MSRQGKWGVWGLFIHQSYWHIQPPRRWGWIREINKPGRPRVRCNRDTARRYASALRNVGCQCEARRMKPKKGAA